MTLDTTWADVVKLIPEIILVLLIPLVMFLDLQWKESVCAVDGLKDSEPRSSIGHPGVSQ